MIYRGVLLDAYIIPQIILTSHAHLNHRDPDLFVICAKLPQDDIYPFAKSWKSVFRLTPLS